jgi:hypothetical protein
MRYGEPSTARCKQLYPYIRWITRCFPGRGPEKFTVPWRRIHAGYYMDGYSRIAPSLEPILTVELTDLISD